MWIGPNPAAVFWLRVPLPSGVWTRFLIANDNIATPNRSHYLGRVVAPDQVPLRPVKLKEAQRRSDTGMVIYLIAEKVEDLSARLNTLGRPVMIDANGGRNDEGKRPIGRDARSASHHPPVQPKKLFPSRHFHYADIAIGPLRTVEFGRRFQEADIRGCRSDPV